MLKWCLPVNREPNVNHALAIYQTTVNYITEILLSIRLTKKEN